MKTQLTPLTDMERSELLICENALSQEDTHFLAVGNALAQVQNGTLYRGTYPTFERYVRERWDMSRAYAYQKIAAAKIVTNLSAIADILPLNEAQTRPLTCLTSDEQREAWPSVLAETQNKPTAKAVSKIAALYRSKPVSIRQTKVSQWEMEKQRADGLEVKVIELKAEVTRLRARIKELEAGAVLDTVPPVDKAPDKTAFIPADSSNLLCPVCNASDYSQCDCDAGVVNALLRRTRSAA